MRIDSGSCNLCGLPIGKGMHKTVFKEKTYRFCCMGCKQVFNMLRELSDSGDPIHFKKTELFKKYRDIGIVPDSKIDLQKRSRLPSSSSFNRPTNYQSEPEIDRLHTTKQSNLNLNLIIKGMWCPACAWVLEETLKKLSGIMDVFCNFSTDRLRCEFNPIQWSPDQIIGVINNLGYQATITGEELEPSVTRKEFIRFAVSAFLTANVMMLSFSLYSGFFTRLTPEAIYKLSWPIFIMASIVFFYGGTPIYQKAWAGLKTAAFGMETLITIGAFSAYLYSTLNLSSGSINLYYDTTAMLITLTLLGKTIERKAKDAIRKDLENFFSLRPTKVKHCSEEFPNGRYVAADMLQKGNVFMTEEGEIIPADGLILEGSGAIDESSLTGEALPVQKTPGDRIRSGTRVLRGIFRIRAEGVGEESTLGQMIKIMEEALSQKTPLEWKTDRILRWFVPLIVTLSIATGLACLVSGLSFGNAMIRSVTVLVIACPCALGIAIPIARVAGISIAGKRGILVRNFSAFKQAERIDTIVFDKTGTLTKGNWELLEIRVIKPFIEERILQLAAALEEHSDHFIATEIVKHAKINVSLSDSLDEVRCYQNGISAILGKDKLKIGSKSFINKDLKKHYHISESNQIDDALKSTVYMSYEDRLCARFVFGDTLRKRVVKTVKNLQDMGYSIALVSGDGDNTTRIIGDLLGIQKAYGEKLPQDKAFFVRKLQKSGKRVAMVGDGVNDAPALVQADLAIAVHSGSQLGKETADITLMQGSPEQIPDYLNLAKIVNIKIQQNLIFSLFYNTISIPIAMSGLLTPLVAVSAMLLSSLTVIGNTLFLVKREQPSQLQPYEIEADNCL